jgi:hypothetical protein
VLVNNAAHAPLHRQRQPAKAIDLHLHLFDQLPRGRPRRQSELFRAGTA